MALQFTRATRQKAHLRLAICGPSGSGKTYTSLLFGSRFSEHIALIDTERGSAKLYGDRFTFDVADFRPPYDPRELVKVMKEAADYVGDTGVLIVDSLSHFWQGEGGVLDIVDEIATRDGSKSNTFGAWKGGSKIQNSLLETMVGLPCHLIVTMRSKQDYVQEKDERTGRTVVRKVGMAPVQREGLEYEFTVTADMDIDHNLNITKTRCSLVADKLYRVAQTGDCADILRDWLAGGAMPEPAPQPATETDEQRIKMATKSFKARAIELGYPADMTAAELGKLIKETAGVDRRPTVQEIGAAEKALKPYKSRAAAESAADHGPPEDAADLSSLDVPTQAATTRRGHGES